MLVKELKKYLEEFDDNLSIILSSDAEVNSFSPLEAIGEAKYVPETTYSGFMCDEEEEKEYEYTNAINSLIFWPVNRE